jgi:hypothetical protein
MLAQLLRRDTPKADWSGQDFAAILQHQLDAPIDLDLKAAGLSSSQMPSSTPAIRTFRDLFNHPQPVLPLIEMVKQFAKQSIDSASGVLPIDIARILYYGAIFLARVHHKRRITSLDETGIRAGAEWALQQKWLDAKLADLFRKHTLSAG